MTRRIGFLLEAAAFFLTAANLPAQSIYGTLTGVVSDPSGAVIQGATVKLTSEASGSLRETKTNTDGYFTFASVAVGDYTYTLSVEQSGFQTYKASGISLTGGEKRNMNVTMTVGAPTQTVEVTGVAETLMPTDSGEKSSTLTTKEIENYVIVSSNAAEFIKVMPGFAITNGTSNKANYTGETIGINANGDAGSQSPLNAAYSYNGLPANSLDITADGAHVSDPGCNCDTPVNPNSEMVSEFKVFNTYSAENQKGPIVVSSVTKSGGRDFHGSGFFSARNFALNANDALNNANGVGRPENKYYYPGGTFGGPVLLPFTNFNRNRDKLFFFTGFEYFYQVLDTGLLRAMVPSANMLTGNFSPAEILATEGTGNNVGGSGKPAGQIIDTQKYPGGIIPQSQLDPNMVALMKLYPQPNADPNATNGYNYVEAATFNQNNRQWMTRADYSISDNTKLYVRYNYQRETQQFPVGLWWRQSDQVPYPTPVLGKNRSDSVTASLTHVFSPSMTNEFIFGYTFIGFPNVFSDPTRVDRSAVGYNYAGLFQNGVAQIPSFGADGSNHEAALVFNPGGFEAGGASSGLYANKYMPSISDMLTKVVSTHTLKAGFFYEWIRNAQPANGNTNSYLQVNGSTSNNPFTLGNEYADLITGNLSSYNESNFNRINDISFATTEFFIQDSWKVTKSLTLDMGIRFTHFTPWEDRVGFGFSIFDLNAYNACTPDEQANPANYCGFKWHKRDPSVPLGGFPTRALFYQPRFGVAWDVGGNGRTVLRGGWGRSYYHSGQFTNGLDAAAGVLTFSLSPASIGNTPLLAKDISSLSATPGAAGAAAVDSKDDKQAYTDNYSFTISQQMPWSSRLDIGYVGNRTRDIPSAGNGASLGANSLNINKVPVGALNSDPSVDPNTLTPDNFRPIHGFSDFFITTHNAYANYNAFQLAWARARGRYNLTLNYTFGKALGIVGFHDQFNLDNNYGVLAGNRTHIFNAAYSIELGNPVRGGVAGGFLNGWQLSGITQIQSGANLTGQSLGDGTSGSYFGLNPNGFLNSLGYAVNNKSILGTTDISLSPLITCDPAKGLGPHQYINPSCFALPTVPGQNGPTVLPAIYGPAFFNTDLALFKNFRFTESKALQFRVNGYNFLNHPLWSFNGQNLGLSFDKATGQLTNPMFGTVTQKQGHRVVQFVVRFLF
ncbi:MAG: carboxypeptidase regulatory-like domain-containing protein [Acidobacteriota bacterium]